MDRDAQFDDPAVIFAMVDQKCFFSFDQFEISILNFRRLKQLG